MMEGTGSACVARAVFGLPPNATLPRSNQCFWSGRQAIICNLFNMSILRANHFLDGHGRSNWVKPIWPGSGSSFLCALPFPRLGVWFDPKSKNPAQSQSVVASSSDFMPFYARIKILRRSGQRLSCGGGSLLHRRRRCFVSVRGPWQ